jgi:putative CocE/NonD family hydrolase
MRKLFCSLLFLLSTFLSFSQTGAHTLDSMWIRDNYYKIERMIPMRDGAKLFTAIYIPKDTTEKHPILMTRTPYSSWPYGEDKFYPYWYNYQRLYLRENYIMVTQDVRGRYMSEGTYQDIRPYNPSKTGNQVDEASDTYDAVEWMLKNIPHNNGRVGVFGISYPGFYSAMAGLSQHPAVKAVSPQAPVTDWFVGDDFHHNGAFFLLDAFSFYSWFGKPRPAPTMNYEKEFQFPGKDNYDFFLRTGTLKNFMRLMGDSVAFWKDMFAHPNYDDWWKARNTRNNAQYFPKGTSSLVVGGLFDAEDLFGAWNQYKSLEENAKNDNRIVVGPWFHGQWSWPGGESLGHVSFNSRTSEWYQNNVEVPYFNYHLKGKGDISRLAEATIFFTGENQWRQFPQWPPAGMQQRNLYLQSNGKLGWNKPGGSGSFTQYTSDPSKPVPYTEDVHLERTREYMTDDQRFASRRPDVLSFETGVLEEDVTLGGPMYADLFASLSSTDADFVVKLIDVFPDTVTQRSPVANSSYPLAGYQMLVRAEIMRGKYRKSYEKPEPFIPGRVEQVKFYLPDVAHTFKKGHRIMVQIQSSWFPLADRNPQKFVNIYEANESDFQKSDIRIFHDSRYPSSVILPVLK